MKFHQIELPIQSIENFCHRWQITEFSLFGSVLRPDFRDDSDIVFNPHLAEIIQWYPQINPSSNGLKL